MLTLFTTPVVYLYFDKLAQRLASRATAASDLQQEPVSAD